jgi:hypothetical protein
MLATGSGENAPDKVQRFENSFFLNVAFGSFTKICRQFSVLAKSDIAIIFHVFLIAEVDWMGDS